MRNQVFFRFSTCLRTLGSLCYRFVRADAPLSKYLCELLSLCAISYQALASQTCREQDDEMRSRAQSAISSRGYGCIPKTALSTRPELLCRSHRPDLCMSGSKPGKVAHHVLREVLRPVLTVLRSLDELGIEQRCSDDKSSVLGLCDARTRP